MELSDAQKVAKDLRVPVWDRNGTEPIKVLVDQLAEFMLLSAYVAADLHSERLDDYLELRPKQLEWDHLEGWEMLRQGKTDSSREEAKRGLRPELHEEIDELKFRIARLTDEIERLNRDAEKAVSRAYTILTGT